MGRWHNDNKINIMGLEYQTGDKIAFSKSGVDVNDARIFVKYKDGRDFFVVQNEFEGTKCVDMMGYNCAWWVDADDEDEEYDLLNSLAMVKFREDELTLDVPAKRLDSVLFAGLMRAKTPIDIAVGSVFPANVKGKTRYVRMKILGVNQKSREITFSICSQKAKARDFAYRASNGFVLCRANMPQVIDDGLYVRGANKGSDTKKLYASEEYVKGAISALEEFCK